MKSMLSVLVLLTLFFGACRNAAAPTGDLQVVIGGLQGGLAADVSVSGHNGFEQALTTGTTLSGLEPGSYEVSARSVEDGGDTYLPERSSHNVTVEAGQTTTVSVVYTRQVTAGSLELTLTGLPEEAEALVTVSGPEDFNRVLAESAVLSSLVPGDYTVTAVDVEVGADIYIPDPSTQTVLVEVGQTATVSVVYHQQLTSTGHLEVIISGLPSDVEGDVSVIDDKGFSQRLTASATLSDLTPGEYTITATEVSTSPYTFAPAQASQVVNVEAAHTLQVTVHYAATTGAVTLSIGGLPSGALASVSFEPVSDPAAEAVPITETATLEDLTPGSYQVSAEAVPFDGFRFEPSPATITVEVDAGETATIQIVYQPVDGKLLVVTEGLPGGVTVTIGNLVGSGLASGREIDTDTFLEGLEPGSYTVSGRLIEAMIDDVWYTVDMPDKVEVHPGEIATVHVRFVAQQGDLTLEISGLPEETEANVTVTGPAGFAIEIKRSTILVEVHPGDYTVTAENVPDPEGGRAFEPCPHEPQTVTVVASGTVAANVHYSKPQEVATQSHCVFFPFSTRKSGKEAR